MLPPDRGNDARRSARSHIEDLKRRLRKRNVSGGFLLPGKRTVGAGYLDPQNSRYAPKLAVGVSAWLRAETDPSFMERKSAKRAMAIWLKKNAARFGLLGAGGRLNEQGIGETAKVVDLQSKGGAPVQQLLFRFAQDTGLGSKGMPMSIRRKRIPLSDSDGPECQCTRREIADADN